MKKLITTLNVKFGYRNLADKISDVYNNYYILFPPQNSLVADALTDRTGQARVHCCSSSQSNSVILLIRLELRNDHLLEWANFSVSFISEPHN